MKIRYLVAIILVLTTNCCVQNVNDKNDYRNELTYEIINSIFSDTTDIFIEPKNIYISEIENLGPPEIGDYYRELDFLIHLLNEKDSINIQEQFRQRKDFSLDSMKTKNVKIIPRHIFNRDITSNDSLWNYVYDNCNGGYYIISMPIFSTDNSLVYIRLGYSCGSLCGGGESRLYKKIKGDWILIKTFGEWIS